LAIPTGGCVRADGSVLLYVGISPKAPPKNGRAPSQQTVRSRIRYHYRGNAAGSTLRLTLVCLLGQQLGISLRRVGSGSRLTFGPDGERHLTDWMSGHARVAWAVVERPWIVEDRLIQRLVLPLNLDKNRHNPFHEQLAALRAEQRSLNHPGKSRDSTS